VEPRALRQWTPAVIAALVFAVVIGASVLGGSGDGTSSAGSAPSTGGEAVTSSVGADETVTTVVNSTAAPASSAPRVPLTRNLSKGVVGDDVKRMQQRLVDLGFDPGPVDGLFGPATMQSVWAFQKLVLNIPREQADGVITPEAWDVMQGEVAILPRRSRTTRRHMEVYLTQQVAVLFKDGAPQLVTHISSGSGEEWCEEVTIDPNTPENETDEVIKKGICGTSITPGGVYNFQRRYVEGDGWREGKLGRMHHPLYFNYGVAVHGSGNVPNRPASHGCVRIPMHISEYFPTLVERGDQIFVWDGVKEPEVYGRQPPPADRRDPDYSTTSSSTTTLAPATTLAPPTTKPATTVPTPATTTPATTTTAPPTTVAATVPATAPPTTAAAAAAAAGP
jgi:peptidoglycan hydrolase-like protein with peptidoglycan-binding domain